jgi:Flp pilus assembly protein TadG
MARSSMTIRGIIARLFRDQKGVAAIEFGLVSSVLIILMVMATDLGLAMQHRSQMESAVRALLRPAGQSRRHRIGGAAMLLSGRVGCELLDRHLRRPAAAGLYRADPGAAASVAARLPRGVEPDDHLDDPYAEGRMKPRTFKRARLLADQSGVAAVEFALIAPAFLCLLMAIIDVSRYMWELNTIQFAIDEAVRAGVIQELSDQDIEDLAVEALVTIDESKVTIDVASDVNSVTVTATSTYTFFFPLSTFSSGATIDLRSEMPL